MWSIRSWDKARKEVKHYRRRKPEKTALYRIVSQYREELPIIWEDRFQPTYGVLRKEVIEALNEYLNCGLLSHGAARAYCDTCKHSMLIAFSCKKRGICLIDDGTVEQILSQEYSGFSVWFGEPFQDPDSARFVARYIERGPISLEKLSIEDDIISYATKDGKTHEFDALEFLALLTCHLPKKYESITRYYGYYSCRARGKRAKLLKNKSDIEVVHEPSPPPSKSWATCIKRILEFNPLLCPRYAHCGFPY